MKGKKGNVSATRTLTESIRLNYSAGFRFIIEYER